MDEVEKELKGKLQTLYEFLYEVEKDLREIQYKINKVKFLASINSENKK